MDQQEFREYALRYAAEHREEKRAYDKRRYKEKREEITARNRRYAKENPDKAAARRARFYENNPDKAREHTRRWRRDNPDKVRTYSRKRRALKRNAAVGDLTALREREAEIHTEPCAHCGTTDNITVDHVVPLARGGPHTADNLQALCFSCNASKGARRET